MMIYIIGNFWFFFLLVQIVYLFNHLRVKDKNVSIKYPPEDLGRYKALNHAKDEPSPNRFY